MGSVRRLVLGAGLSVAAAASVSATYQTLAERADRRRFPPPGQLVDVGGRRLHLWCRGGDSDGPTVVVIPAMGTSMIEWVGLQRELVADDVRICLYDRGGLGWSDHIPGPRDFGRLAEELHTLLLAADIRPPWILAGHSIGGPVARLFTGRHREQVAGLVLIDASHEDQVRRLSDWHRPREYRRTWAQALLDSVPGRGFTRARAEAGLLDWYRICAEYECPPDLIECGIALALTTRKRRAAVRELHDWPTGSQQVATERARFGDLPLSVITRSATPSAPTPYGRYTGEDAAGRERAWLELQRDLTTLSNEARHVISAKGGHNVHLDDPALVIQEIRSMFWTVRDSIQQLREGESRT